MLMLVLLSLALSIDSLGIGLSYGIRKIKISFGAMVIISFVTLIVCGFSALIGSVLPIIFNESFGVILGALVLAIIGGVIIYNSLEERKEDKEPVKKEENTNSVKAEKKTIFSIFIKAMGITINIIKEPEISDVDKSKVIEAKEAFYLGLALCLDSVGAAVGSGAIGTKPWLFAVLICVFQLMFLLFGSMIGGKIKIKGGKKHIAGVLSGVVLIVIAVINIMTL